MRSMLIALAIAGACHAMSAEAAEVKPMFCMLDHVDGAPNTVLFTEVFEADASDFRELSYATQFEAAMRAEGRKVHGEATCSPGASRDAVAAEMVKWMDIASGARNATEVLAWRPSDASAALARRASAPPQWMVLDCNILEFNQPIRVDRSDDLQFVFIDDDPGGEAGSRRALRVRAFDAAGAERAYDVTATLERGASGASYRLPGFLRTLFADHPDGALLDLVDPASGAVVLRADTRGLPPKLQEIRACG